MKNTHVKMLLIMITVLILFLLVNAGTEVNVVTGNDENDTAEIEEIEGITEQNTIRIGTMDIPIKTYRNIGITEKQTATIKNVIKNDFLINDDTLGGTASQYDPKAAMDYNGNFVIVFEDNRNGNSDIYAQRYDNTGAAIDVYFRVNDDVKMDNQYDPSIVMDSVGNFVITFEDDRNGNRDIYAQRYDNTGVAQGVNFRVNDDAGTDIQYDPKIAIDNAGNFVITFEDNRNGNRDIYAQRYDNTGALLGVNFRVNDDAGTDGQYDPSVAMDNAGNFVIVFEDNRNGNRDIYAQRYDNAGALLGVNFKVNDDAGTDTQYDPSVAMDNAGNFVITFEDNRNGNRDIYVQGYDNTGALLGVNFMVNDDAGTDGQYDPKIVMDSAGNFVICFEDRRNGNTDIYVQRYNNVGVSVGTNFRVNDDAGTSNQYDPSIAMNAAGVFVIVFEDYRNGKTDIYAQRYDNTGAAQGTNFKVNNDAGINEQYYPSVSMDNAGNFVITWIDYRSTTDYDIYAQRYDNTGAVQGVNFKVNDDAGTSEQYNPSVSMDNAGNFVITWMDVRSTTDGDIYAQRYDNTGAAQGTNFKVNDDTGTDVQELPSVAISATGNFVITWMDFRSTTDYDIYAQRYDNTGAAQGTNFKVNDDAGTDDQGYSSVAINAAGNFVITWMDFRSTTDFDIYAQRYDNAGALLGVNFKVNDDAGTDTQYYPSISMDNAGNFVITWMDYRSTTDYDIYAQRYDNTGAAQGTNFKSNDDAGTSDQYYPCVSMAPDSNRFIVYWTDYRNPDGDPEIMTQKYVDGSPVDPNMQINVDSLPYYHQMSWKEGIACNNDLIIFAWMDDRRAKGWDIYGKLTDWDVMSGIEEYPITRKIENKKISVYPNPFFKSINISGGTGKYMIYNVSGRLVRKLHNGYWDIKDNMGKEINNGIYFIRCDGYKSVKIIKMK